MREIEDALKMRDRIIKMAANHRAIFTTPYFLLKSDMIADSGYTWLNAGAEEQFNILTTEIDRYNKIIAEYRHEEYLRDKREYEKRM